MLTTQHFTTRRSFIATAGFGGLSLYGLWAAYGGAPGPFSLLGAGHNTAHAPEAGGHGAVGNGPTVGEFRRLTADFVQRYRMPDGSVYPRPLHPDAASATIAPILNTEHMGHAAQVLADKDSVNHAEGTPQYSEEKGHVSLGTLPVHAGTDVLDIHLLAEKWFYEPGHLRLDVGAPYRFRMMATDISHGASIQFGGGSRMIRLRPGSITEMEASFTQPGRYLVYCTVYCGDAHDLMQGRIDVA
jgi:hypothetical protein